MLALLLISGSAWARGRIAVTRFTGKGASAQKLVQDIVRRDGTLVSDAAVRRAQKKLHIRALTEATIARLAAELQVDAIVQGSVQRTGVRWGLTLTILDGKTGSVSDTISVALRSDRLDADGQREVTAKLTPALAKVGALREEPPPVEVAPAPPEVDIERAPVAAPAAPEPPPPPAPRPTAAADEGRYSRDAAADVEIGMSAVVRNLSFTSAADLTPAQKPAGYKGSLVPSLLVSGELYPLAFGGRGALAGLGLAFVVDKVLVIKSRLSSTSTEYPTSQLRWGAGLRWRFNLGDSATGPTVKLGAGYDKLDFSIDHGSDDIGLPDVSYSCIDVGASGRLPIASPRFAFYLDLRYLQVLDPGPIGDKDQYGGGTVRGFAGEAGLELIFAGRGVARAGARYQRMAFSFDGSGTLANNLDGNPASQDVGGALDEYWSGYATVGYLF